MSYATLCHDNRSRHTISQLEGTYSPPVEFASHSEDGSAMDTSEQGDLDRSFELKDLTRSRNGSRYLGPTIGPEFEDFHSDDEEKSSSFLRSHRVSAATLQSFMLYTPDEERSVIRKFDCRLVLFVALLYMLSFLDRSSMFSHLTDCSVLTVIRYRQCENCRFVRGFTSKLVAV